MDIYTNAVVILVIVHTVYSGGLLIYHYFWFWFAAIWLQSYAGHRRRSNLVRRKFLLLLMCHSNKKLGYNTHKYWGVTNYLWKIKKYSMIRGGGRLFNTARYLNATKYVQFQLRFSVTCTVVSAHTRQFGMLPPRPSVHVYVSYNKIIISIRWRS